MLTWQMFLVMSPGGNQEASHRLYSGLIYLTTDIKNAEAVNTCQQMHALI